jgi:hypothetical protein
MKELKSIGIASVSITYIIAVGISVMVLTWIHKLEDTVCKCSVDFKRDYIKYYLYAYIVFYTLWFFAILYMMYFFYLNNILANGLISLVLTLMQTFLPIFSILNIVFSIMYIWHLKEIDCKCSEDIRREIYYILNWISIGFIIMAIIIILFVAIGGMFFMGRLLNNNSK